MYCNREPSWPHCQVHLVTTLCGARVAHPRGPQPLSPVSTQEVIKMGTLTYPRPGRFSRTDRPRVVGHLPPNGPTWRTRWAEMGEQRRRVKAARSPKRQEPGDMCVEGQLTRRKRRPAVPRARGGLSAPRRLHSQTVAAAEHCREPPSRLPKRSSPGRLERRGMLPLRQAHPVCFSELRAVFSRHRSAMS